MPSRLFTASDLIDLTDGYTVGPFGNVTPIVSVGSFGTLSATGSGSNSNPSHVSVSVSCEFSYEQAGDIDVTLVPIVPTDVLITHIRMRAPGGWSYDLAAADPGDSGLTQHVDLDSISAAAAGNVGGGAHNSGAGAQAASNSLSVTGAAADIVVPFDGLSGNPSPQTRDQLETAGWLHIISSIILTGASAGGYDSVSLSFDVHASGFEMELYWGGSHPDWGFAVVVTVERETGGPDVTISWTDTNSGGATYEVQRSVAGENSWTTLTTISGITYTDETADVAIAYDYKVITHYNQYTHESNVESVTGTGGGGGGELALGPEDLPEADQDVPYSVTFVATGGTPPYAFSIAEGSVLPGGFILDPTSGQMSGREGMVAEFSFGITVTDTDAAVVTRYYTLLVTPYIPSQERKDGPRLETPNRLTAIGPPPSVVTITATVIDPESLISSYDWTQESGPETATINDPTLPSTFVVLSGTPGDYEFKLTASGSGFPAVSKITIVTVPKRKKPHLTWNGG